MFGFGKPKKQERKQKFTPKEDMTAYELALIVKRVNRINCVYPDRASPPFTDEEASMISRHFEDYET